MEYLEQKMAQIGHQGRVIVFSKWEWRIVTHIPKNTGWQGYTFDNQCSIGDATVPTAGDAVFSLCSNDSWRENLGNLQVVRQLSGQASMFYVLG